jgi:hypothetical protein
VPRHDITPAFKSLEESRKKPVKATNCMKKTLSPAKLSVASGFYDEKFRFFAFVNEAIVLLIRERLATRVI